MKKDKLKELSTEELIGKKKLLKAAIYLSVLALLLFFVATLWSFKRGKLEITEFITPTMVLICLFFSLNFRKNLRQELSNREIDSF